MLDHVGGFLGLCEKFHPFCTMPALIHTSLSSLAFGITALAGVRQCVTVALTCLSWVTDDAKDFKVYLLT